MPNLQHERRKDSVKQPRKPTRNEKEFMSKRGYDPSNYMVYYDDNRYLHIIPKGGKPKDVVIIEKE